MKKNIFIFVGIVILLLVIAVWAYLFTFGAPKNGAELFTRFGVGGDVENFTPPESTSVDVSDVNSAGATQALKQLTTRPVAGAVFVDGGIRYVEQGTGHIYDINLQSGTETLQSGTTIPSARDAIFSDGGSYTAITMLDEGKEKTLVGKLGSGAQFSGVTLPLGAKNITFVNASGTLEYTVHEGSNTHGYSYNMLKEVDTMVFTLPLKDVNVLWGNPTYVYTTPSTKQEGYLYQVIKNNLHYVTKGGRGLASFATHDGVMVTSSIGTLMGSFLISSSGERITQPLPYIPEKCVSGETFIYCAIPKETIDTQTFPDDWYMGDVSFNDSLWSVHTKNQKAEMLVDFRNESGRAIDVLKIGADREGKRVYLINKNDNTLWLFDTTL